MLKTGLEFARGTTDDCKRLAQRLFKPEELLGAYRAARQSFKTGDLVLTIAAHDPRGFEAEPRSTYTKRLRQHMRPGIAMPTIMDRSAHGVVQLPFESDAMWLVIVRPGDMPIMCVIYATPYETVANAN